ncbi:MAG: CRISPR system precrRNA processing endoribonuclease RAMP protein Cas6 [Desulfurococcales archaeon]|nr:CRISPR system precrRNA processing endoribonuclease RAMP protein Cas6 [Desulfurococcales archaeon]
MENVKAIRAWLTIEAEEPIATFTGQLVKTLLYTLNREIRLLHGMRGIISPIHISPLFTPGRRFHELGTLVTPLYRYNKNVRAYELDPIKLNGEYVIHIGGDASLIDLVSKSLARLRSSLMLKYTDNIVTFKLEKIEDVTSHISRKNLDSDKITLYLKGPVKPFNVIAPSRLPKFSISSYEILITGYMYFKRVYTLTYHEVVNAMRILGLLVETYYSLNTVKPVLIPYKGKEPAMIGKITYIVDTNKPEEKQTLNKILNIAEITGTGESRSNGFGTVTWITKT